MTGLWQTLIGAAASILGGLLAVWWQSRHAHEVASQIRRQERRDEGLLALYPVTVEVFKDGERPFLRAEADPEAWRTVWPELRTAVERLATAWDTNGPGRIPDQSLVRRALAIKGLLHDSVSRFGAANDRRVLTATGQEFVGEARKLLNAVNELRNEIEDLLQGWL